MAISSFGHLLKTRRRSLITRHPLARERPAGGSYLRATCFYHGLIRLGIFNEALANDLFGAKTPLRVSVPPWWIRKSE